MKKYLLPLLLISSSLIVSAQNTEYVYTEAAELTLVGKLMPDRTPFKNPSLGFSVDMASVSLSILSISYNYAPLGNLTIFAV